MRGMTGTRSAFVEWPDLGWPRALAKDLRFFERNRCLHVVARDIQHRHRQYAEAEASETCDERPHGDHDTCFPVVCGGGECQEPELDQLRTVDSQLKSKEKTRLDGFGRRANLFHAFSSFAAVAN